ncbi:hypothetical protein E8E12_002851 [Didymella heteroderae]|uniref:Uncharacterized protein n=1 Tax=Didymella heteroderae TaxID=1769908 RepID=A0A9P4WIZ9_9PLEO|nr:hypothetical protein E8E12_002851 [Didymella heteroderae]
MGVGQAEAGQEMTERSRQSEPVPNGLDRDSAIGYDNYDFILSTSPGGLALNLKVVSDTLKPGYVEHAGSEYSSRLDLAYTVQSKQEVEYSWSSTRKLRIKKDSNSTTTTVPTTVVTENSSKAKRLQNDRGGQPNMTYSVYAPQPVVKLVWGDRMRGYEWTPSSELAFVRDDGITRGILSNMSDVVGKVRGQSENIVRSDHAWQYFDPVWMPSPEIGSSSLIGLFFRCMWFIDENTPPARVEQLALRNLTQILDMNPEQRSNCTAAVSTISASWNNSEAILDPHGLRFNSLTNWWDVLHERPIALDLSGVDTVNATFHRTMATLYDDYDIYYEDVIGTALAMAISEVQTELYPERGFRDAHDIIAHNHTGEDLADVATFTYTVTEIGYGYGTTSIAIRLSIVVVSFYCVVTILYLAYILITGSTSTAGNSAIELVALALQSKRPDHLGRISAGINTLGTFNEGVGIRVNADDELELVFASDRDIGSTDLRKIERNKAY